MSENDRPINQFTFADFKLKSVSSADTVNRKPGVDESEAGIRSANARAHFAEETAADGEIETEEPAIENPIFKELSEPKLPELAKEDRARLQLQSPNRVYFYWSFKQNPLKTLSRAVGANTNYQLIIKLVNRTNGREELFPADATGSAWFDVSADSIYQAEIGFYAASRPFVRLMFSNSLQTPRKNPSPRQDYSERFAVSADQFAKVLDVSGFSQDAFEVALAGDDIEAADRATEAAFAQIFNAEESAFDPNQSGEMRFVLLALASGYALADLREQISPRLFAFLQSRAGLLNAEKALAALQENFGVTATDETETVATESFGAAVFGASLINFPSFSKRKLLPKFSPLSSHFSSEGFDTRRHHSLLKLPQANLPAASSLAVLHVAVDYCAQQMFGVQLMTNGMWSDKGQNGEMKFKVMPETAVIVYGSTGITTKLAKTFSVYNDATSYSMAALGSLGIGGGGGVSKGIYEYYSDRVKKRIFTNQTYTASDADMHNPVTPNGVMLLISNFKSIQIHETGNALSKIIGKSETAGNWTDLSTGTTYWFGTAPPVNNSQNINSSDWDAGQAFELKVLLKYRQLMGM